MDELLRQLDIAGWKGFCTSAEDGNMSFKQADDEKAHEEVAKNIKNIIKANKVQAKKHILLAPSHLNGVVELLASRKAIFEKKAPFVNDAFVVHADAIVTNCHDYVFTLKPADCATVFLTSSHTKWVGFVHVGYFNILMDTIPAVMGALSVYDNEWKAFVFRHIHKESYKYTGKEIMELTEKAGYADYIEEVGKEKYELDLTKAVEEELTNNGVDEIFFDEDDNFKLALEGKSFSHSAFANGKQKNDYRFMVGIWKSEEE